MIFAPANVVEINKEIEDGVTISSLSQPERSQIINKNEWSLLSLDQLIDQRSLIYDKYIFLKSKSYEYAKDFETLYNEIDSFISTKV